MDSIPNTVGETGMGCNLLAFDSVFNLFFECFLHGI